VLALALRARFDRINVAAFYSTLWVVLTAGLVGALRQNTASRYSIYSLLALIFCYCFLAQYLPERVPVLSAKRFYAISTILALLFFVHSNKLANLNLSKRRELVLAGMEHYRANPQINSPTVDPQVEKLYPEEQESERTILNQSVQEKVYTVPPAQ
jgi:hypothetical protein